MYPEVVLIHSGWAYARLRPAVDRGIFSRNISHRAAVAVDLGDNMPMTYEQFNGRCAAINSQAQIFEDDAPLGKAADQTNGVVTAAAQARGARDGDSRP